MTNLFKQIYVRTTGYSYTHMGRLFLRLFVGVMLMQFGLRQLYHFDVAVASFPSVLGMTPEASLIVMIIIEILCSLCIMVGFLTRIMIIPPFLAMIFAEHYLLSQADMPAHLTTWASPVYTPMLFLGIFFFLMLVGPGKISCDYFLSLHFIHSENAEEEELEEV
ncbi:MAG: DoxX family protein [Muribaculaceae bacterium]|nr:DoxX family protein [Muribaculaceae bacterium]